MEVRALDDPRTWLDTVAPLLLGDEARHDLAFGIADTLIRHPSVYPSRNLWAVDGAAGVVGAALQTPPHNVAIARPAEPGVTEALARAIRIAGIDLPGVTGADPEARDFADAWQRLTRCTVRHVIGQGVYRLDVVQEVPTTPGGPRRAEGPGDLDLIMGWMVAFDEEVVPPEIRGDPEHRRRRLETVFASDEGGFWLWEDSARPVSMAGVGSFTPNGARVGPVYTPPDARGHGYATSLVAHVSREQLSRGRTFCFLHTDLANPTSNGIYRRIGYERVCDAVALAFDPA
jgi:uncharacterized protein